MAEIDYVQEGANLKINSAYKSIMKESKQNFIDGMNAYQAKDYLKAKALITKAKNSFEKGYWSIYDADKPAAGCSALLWQLVCLLETLLLVHLVYIEL